MPCWSCPVNLSRSDQDFHSLRCRQCLPSVAQGKATTVTVKKSWGTIKGGIKGSWRHLRCFWSVVSHCAAEHKPSAWWNVNLEVNPHCCFSSKCYSHWGSLHNQDVTVCALSPHTGIFLYNSKLNLIFTEDLLFFFFVYEISSSVYLASVLS